MKVKRIKLRGNECSECRLCEMICALTNKGKISPSLSAITIVANPLILEHPKLTVCRHCKEPQCLESCSEGAINLNMATQTIHIEYDKCTGCFSCIEACPFESIKADDESNLPIKCDLYDNLIIQSGNSSAYYTHVDCLGRKEGTHCRSCIKLWYQSSRNCQLP